MLLFYVHIASTSQIFPRQRKTSFEFSNHNDLEMGTAGFGGSGSWIYRRLRQDYDWRLIFLEVWGTEWTAG